MGRPRVAERVVDAVQTHGQDRLHLYKASRWLLAHTPKIDSPVR